MDSIRAAEEFNVPLEQVHKVIEVINYVPEADTKYFRKLGEGSKEPYYIMTAKGYNLLYGYFAPKKYAASATDFEDLEFWEKISSVQMRDSRKVAAEFNVSHTELKKLLESNKFWDFVPYDPDDKIGYWIIDQFDTSDKEKIEAYYATTPMVYETIRRYFEERRSTWK